MNIQNLLKNINIDNDEYIIVGVSAGPDSMALLDMLKKSSIAKIVCAHINHNVRKESDEEEEYLREYCNKSNIIFESIKIDSWEKNNFENEARTKRYQFYEELLKKYNSHNLFLAHHGDDLIETVLMKIIRGSNLEGYAGIKMYSFLENYKIIRPLLSLTKEDILKYNKDNNIKYYIDKSNSDTLYTRNRLRKNILPLLKEENKDIHIKFLKYSNTLEDYYNYVEYLTKDKIKKIENNNIINVELLKKEHPFMQRNIIFYILSKIYNNEANIIKDKNIDDIIKLIKTVKPNQYINLPRNYLAIKEYNKIIIKKENNHNDNYKILLKDKIKINNIEIKKVKEIDTDGNDVCRLNSKNISLPLYIRNRLDGDTIEVLGLNGTKKIKEIFIEEKIPISERNTYPMLVDSNNKILWIPNIKKSKYNVKKDEMCDIILTSHTEREENNEK